MKSVRVACAGALLGLLAGCGGNAVAVVTSTSASPSAQGYSPTDALPAAVLQAQQAKTAVDPALVAANNGFGLSLLQSILQTSTGNVAVSPISAGMALQIVYNGAAGSTQQAMAHALQLGSLTTSALNNDNAALEASLISPDPVVQVLLANSLWTNLAVQSSFIQTDETFYDATIGNLTGAPGTVNAWVAKATDNLIPTVLPANYPLRDVKVIIANALYFKGQWTDAFDPSQTVSAPFARVDGSQVMVPMMNQSTTHTCLVGSNFQAVRLPYGQSGRFDMLLVLPNWGADIGGFVAGLSLDDLSAAQTLITPTAISLPRFTASFGASLTPNLIAMGMGSAFSGTADFSGIANGLHISDVVHKTLVEVDESGTTAAAVTVIVATDKTASFPPCAVMNMNRPFLYAIEDSVTGSLLFIGVLMDPTAG